MKTKSLESSPLGPILETDGSLLHTTEQLASFKTHQFHQSGPLILLVT